MQNPEEIYASSIMLNRHKYNGLIKRSIFKNYRDDCFRYFDYLYTIASPHENIIQFSRILHYIQVSLISLCPSSKIFWPKDTVLGKIMNVLAVIGNICPPRSSEMAYIIITLLIYSLLISFIILLFITVSYFRKYTKVNHRLINFTCVILNAFLPYFVLYIGSNIGRGISIIVKYYSSDQTQQFKSSCYYECHIVCLCLGIVLLISLFTVQLLFVTPTITFRPQAIHLLCSSSMFLYLFSFLLISIFTSAAGFLDNGIILFGGVIPLFPLYYLFTYYCIDSWSTLEFRVTTFSVLITVSILLIVDFFFLILKVAMNEILLFVVTLLFIFIINISPLFNTRIVNQYLASCDRLVTSPQTFSKLAEYQVIYLLRIGFENGHKICHDWSLFDLANTQFPKSRKILLLLLRYSTIYPNESQVVRVVISRLHQFKKHDIELKYMLFQLTSICQQRERGLSKNLKKSFQHLDNKIDKCRNQIRFIWNSIIQGNISVIGNLSLQLKKSTDEITREFNQLCISYPNNPYVASSFSTFLSDILCKENESFAFKRVYRLLRSGGKTRFERTYYFARELFHSLPTEDRHDFIKNEENEGMKMQKQKERSSKSSVISISVEELNNFSEEIDEEKSQTKLIENMIESIRFPSLRYGPVLIFIISLIFPILSTVFCFLIVRNLDLSIDGCKLVQKECLQQAEISHIALTFFYYVLNSNRIITSLTDILGYDEMSNAELLLSFSRRSELLMNEINQFFPVLFETGYFESTLDFFFNDTFHFCKVFTNYSSSIYERSFEFFMTIVTESAVRATPLRPSKLLNMSDFWTIIYSFPMFVNEFDEFAEIQFHELNKMINGNYNSAFFYSIFTGSVSIFLALLITLCLFNRMSDEKAEIINCFKSIPKSAASATIIKLNAQLGKHEDEMAQNFFSLKEEKIMRTFLLQNNQQSVKRFDFSLLIILLIFVISALVNLFFLIQSPLLLVNNLPNKFSLMYSTGSLHSTFAAIILNELRLITYDQRQLPYNTMQTKTDLVTSTSDLFNKLNVRLHRFLFGETVTKGLHGSNHDYIDFFTETPVITADQLPDDETEVVRLLSVGNSIYHIAVLLKDLFVQLNHDTDSIAKLDHHYMSMALIWLFSTSRNDIVERTANESIEYSESLRFKAKYSFLIIPLVILNVTIFICGLVLIPRFVKNAEAAKWTMRLLLFCPPAVVLQSRPIMKILSNDASKADSEENVEKSQFYTEVISKANEIALFFDNDLIARSCNKAFDDMFKEDVIGRSVFDVFESPTKDNLMLLGFKERVRDIRISALSPSIEGDFIVYCTNSAGLKEPRKLHYLFLGVDINGLIPKTPVISDGISFYTLILKDVTDAIATKERLEKEEARLREMLKLTIPARVVSKFISNENECLYDLQIASFIYVDFINIGRLSANIPPSEFLSAYQSMILEIDANLEEYNQLIKLNSLGSNYVVAGGIFCNENFDGKVLVNQAVSFALEIIAIVEDFIIFDQNFPLKEIELKVGVSCGGPVVAGVLNLSMPTFSVFGSPMELAIELEKNGAPMYVHMPQGLYEFVFDRNKDLEVEISEIMFQGEAIETYLIKESYREEEEKVDE